MFSSSRIFHDQPRIIFTTGKSLIAVEYTEYKDSTTQSRN